ncbi:MAG: flagellar motor protein MotB [Pseudomonadota bacterium]
MAADNGVTIIRRRKVMAAPPHHGGAWKVAYADFVTAMMAFFLLMWLLSATTEEQREGIAEYFNPSVPMARTSGGGAGALGGDSVFTEKTLARNGAGASDKRPTQERQARGERGLADSAEERPEGVAEELSELDNLFRGMSGESDRADALLQHIRTRITDEGLIIELFDVPGKPLYADGSARPTPRMRALLKMIGETAALVTNRAAILGHADSPGPEAPAEDWRTAIARADGARRALVDAGVAADRMARVTGEPRSGAEAPDAPGAPARERRLAITLLRSDL